MIFLLNASLYNTKCRWDYFMAQKNNENGYLRKKKKIEKGVVRRRLIFPFKNLIKYFGL